MAAAWEERAALGEGETFYCPSVPFSKNQSSRTRRPAQTEGRGSAQRRGAAQMGQTPPAPGPPCPPQISCLRPLVLKEIGICFSLQRSQLLLSSD